MKLIISTVLLLLCVNHLEAHDVSQQVDELNERLTEATASLEALLNQVEEQGWDKLLRRALVSTQEDRSLDNELAEIEKLLFGEVKEDTATEQEEQDEIAEIEDLLGRDANTQGWGSSISHAFHKVVHTVKKVAKKICDTTALDQEVAVADKLLDAREQLQTQANIQEVEMTNENLDLGEDELAEIASFLDQTEEQEWSQVEVDNDPAVERLQALLELVKIDQQAKADNKQAKTDEILGTGREGEELSHKEVVNAFIYRLMTKKLMKILQDKDVK